jgi:hypothetical protein
MSTLQSGNVVDLFYARQLAEIAEWAFFPAVVLVGSMWTVLAVGVGARAFVDSEWFFVDGSSVTFAS